ncbi:MAG: NAD(P)/FAD-dependent oxidoreductase [Alphaproteobacteria bacterium]|nr:MAG: NAD(P)/FAD-dependent oxidoreductase [Alphaproteobacteria bacterium]
MFDAIVIGGSYSGLSAALQLARARQKILVIDAGQPRNRFAAHSHGFITHDGSNPREISHAAKLQLQKYPTVLWLDAYAQSAAKTERGFTVEAAGQVYETKRIVLAMGVSDGLPKLEGLAERWGKSVFHCPYCHGFELDQGKIGVLAVSPVSMHHALMLPDWGETTFFLNRAFEPDEAQLAQLAKRGVTVERSRVLYVSGHADMHLDDGRIVTLDGLFTVTATKPSSPIAAQLGCAFVEGPTGPFISINEMKETSVPGVLACGDAARAAGSVALAVGDGAMAGAATHRSLMFADL